MSRGFINSRPASSPRKHPSLQTAPGCGETGLGAGAECSCPGSRSAGREHSTCRACANWDGWSSAPGKLPGIILCHGSGVALIQTPPRVMPQGSVFGNWLHFGADRIPPGSCRSPASTWGVLSWGQGVIPEVTEEFYLFMHLRLG